MVFVPFMWPITGGVQLLGWPPGFDFDHGDGGGEMYTVDCSDDGSVIVGYYWLDYYSDDGRPCRWDNGVFTALTGPGVIAGRDVYPQGVSADGSVVVGTDGNANDPIRWTTPTNGTRLPPLSGGTFTYSGGNGRSMMSRDGSKVVGTTYMPAVSQYLNTVWTNGTPASWGNIFTTSHSSEMMHISGDGSTILGNSRSSAYGVLGYWRSPSLWNVLKGAGGVSGDVAIGYLYGSNHNGTVFYGETNDQYGIRRACYWDNVSSVTGSANFGTVGSGPLGVQPLYGDVHILPSPGQGRVEEFARNSAVRVCVGNGYNQQGHAARWDSGVFRNLQPNPLPGGGFPMGRGMCVSDDGVITAGNALDDNVISGAAYWDASGTKHILPLPNNETYNSYVNGLNANGSIMHGAGDYYVTEVPPSWQLVGAPKGAVADVWTDPSYVNFADVSIRNGFINADNSWLTLGDYGELPTGTSPMSFLTAQDSYDPWRITYGFGQNGGESGWDHLSTGLNPTTGEPYPDLYFDVCLVGVTDSELVFHAVFVDLSVEANRRKFVSAEGTPQWLEPDGSLPFNTSPSVYLTTMAPPLDFAQNNGVGGSFPVHGTISGAEGPGCSTYGDTSGYLPPLADPQWRLSVSDDGGRTWSRLVKPRALGQTGKYLTRLRWLKMGQFRQRSVKLESTANVRNTIVGIYIDLDQGMS